MEELQQKRLPTRPYVRPTQIYEYTARGLTGQYVEGEIQAPSAEGAVSALQTGGIVVTGVKQLKEKWASLQPVLPHKLDHYNLLLDSWARLMEANFTVQEAIFRLTTVVQSPTLARSLSRVHVMMQQGAHVAEAFEEERLLPASWLGVLSQVETYGDYIRPLRLLMKHGRYYKSLKQQVVSMMLGPSILLGLLAIWGWLLFTHVLPSLYQFLAGIGVVHNILPVLVWQQYAQWLSVAVLVSGLAMWWAGRSNREIGWLHTYIPPQLPLLGPLVSQMQLLNIAANLNMQVEAGIPIINAFENLAKGVRNPFIHTQLKQTAAQLRSGVPMVRALESLPLLNASHRALIVAGHESGQLGAMFAAVQKHAEIELFDVLNRFVISLRSLVVLLIGVFIGVVIITFFAILFSLA